MKKKLLTLLMLGAIAASLTACGGEAETEASATTETVTESITETQETTAPTESETEIETETESETITETQETTPETELNFSFESLGMSVPIPESWVITDVSTDGDVTDVYYSCGAGRCWGWISVSEYSEDIADMSDILIYAALSGYEKDDSYMEIQKNKITVDGKPGQAAAFFYQDSFHFLTSVNSGRSIVNFVYIGTIDDSEELHEYSQMIDNTKFDISSDSENSESEMPASETELQSKTVSNETDPQTEYVEKVWIPNSGSKYHRTS